MLTPTTHKLHAHLTMEEAGVRKFEVETASTPVSILDEVIRAKILNLTKSKVAQTRTGMVSTLMSQMVLLDQIDPRRLKLKPDNKDDCHTHRCKHLSTLMKTL